MEGKIRLAVFGQKRLSREGGIEIVVKELCTRMAQNTSSERNRTNGIFRGRGRRRIPGAIAPDRLNGKDLPPHHPGVCGLRTRIPDRTALRAMMA